MDSNKMKEMEVEAKKMATLAYAPYSKFSVGASLLTAEGKIFGGHNIENASYGATVCAERVAIFKALSSGENNFKGIYIYSKHGVAPCGICRQVMAEFFHPLTEVVLADHDGSYQITNLEQLLPNAFTKKSLQNT